MLDQEPEKLDSKAQLAILLAFLAGIGTMYGLNALEVKRVRTDVTFQASNAA